MADTIMWPKDVFKSTLNSLDSNADMTLCLFPTKYPQKFGMVSYNSEMKVKKIVDKPITTDLTFMWGAIIWQPTFSDFLFKKVNINESSDFAEIINLAIDNHLLIKTKTFPTGRFVDFGTYEQILDTSLMNPIRYD
jgi:glucose-1-phosphate thymidylyltransferase